MLKNPAVSDETNAIVGSFVVAGVGTGVGLVGPGVGFADGAGKAHDPSEEQVIEPGYCCMHSLSLEHRLQ